MEVQAVPVGMPNTLDPRPNPLMTGPPRYHGSIGNASQTSVEGHVAVSGWPHRLLLRCNESVGRRFHHYL